MSQKRLEVPTSITIDGVVHEVSKFSEQVKHLLAVHTEWRNDLIEDRLRVAKTEAAIRSLDAELTQQVSAELNPPEPAETPAA